MAFSEFRPLDENSLIEYIKATPSLSSKIGHNYDGLKIKEVGDGNLNFVYIILAPSGSFVIKQVSLFFFFLFIFNTRNYEMGFSILCVRC